MTLPDDDQREAVGLRAPVGEILSPRPLRSSTTDVIESSPMSISFRHVVFEAAPALVPELSAFYADALGLRLALPDRGDVAVVVGETTLEFRAGHGHPFYHYAFLVPGDRFDAAYRWAAERVAVLSDEGTGAEVFDFEHWDAQAVYFHDPAGSIGELIAHRSLGESGATGRFHPDELLGLSEVGIVGHPPLLADALAETFALEVWSGSATEEGGLAFVGEKARTLILSRAARPWLPTGRPAEAHPVEVVLTGVTDGEVQLESGIVVSGRCPPASRLTGYGRSMQVLDTFLPRFDVNETHSISLACGAERALELALAAPAAPGRLVAALFRARGLPPATSVQGLFDRMGFDTLSTSPTEVVLGACGTPWRPSGGLGAFVDARPGTVRVATDIRATPVDGGCILSTETRIAAVDDAARRAFRRYWTVVGPFSALIRRRWLRAAQDATTRDASGETGVRN